MPRGKTDEQANRVFPIPLTLRLEAGFFVLSAKLEVRAQYSRQNHWRDLRLRERIS